MSRFTIAKRKGGKSAMRVVNKKNLLAFFDFQDADTGLTFRDFKLMSGKNGIFVGSPTGEPYEDGKGQTRYPEYISSTYDPDTKSNRSEAGDNFFKTVAELAKEEYDKLSDGGSGSDDEDEAPRTSKKKAGAGPMRSAPSARDTDEEDDDLPF